MENPNVYKSPGIYYDERTKYSTPSLEEYLKGISIEHVINVLGVENVQNYLRYLKINKIKNGK